ncbi:DDE superfamily endonuclease [Phytophthora infestans]|uniref:DDE superfamily endonuclease n=1 Tax=Phytophthora infestans TaxID=4787 RepID=A0A833SS40_PHYIN|nr:DDE superfamily endonuclease [Phytophthora infestans]
MLRCSKASFLAIAEQLRLRDVLFAGCVAKQHSYEKKSAAALYSFASPSGYREVAAAMGMNKSYVMDIVDEVCRVLYLSTCDAVSFPRDHQGWKDLQAGFAARRGYPGVVGAVDGSLLAIDRPEDYDGFYCRKGYPALSIQAIVTATSIFMSVEIRPGSWSDSKSWKHSIIGRRAASIIPVGTHFIGESGYALLPHLMVLYAEREEGGRLNALQRRYNFLHSSTRMAVECTFGLWKGRFRVLQTVMDEKTIVMTKRVAMATIVFHNWMLALRDTTRITPYVESTEYEASEIDDHSASDHAS